jgi:hypothetical protein
MIAFAYRSLANVTTTIGFVTVLRRATHRVFVAKKPSEMDVRRRPMPRVQRIVRMNVRHGNHLAEGEADQLNHRLESKERHCREVTETEQVSQ